MRPAAAIVAVSLALLFAPFARASKPDFSPRHSVILRTTPGVIVQSAMKTASLYDLQGTLIRTFDLGQWISAMAVSLDEQLLLLASHGGRVRVWRIVDGGVVHTITAPNYVTSAAFAADGSAFVVGDGSGVSVSRTSDGTLLHRGNLGTGYAPTLTPDGSAGVVGTSGDEAYLFSVKDGTTRKLPLKNRRPVQFTSDGRFALLPGKSKGDRDLIRVLDGKTLEEVAEIETPAGRIYRIRPMLDRTEVVTLTEAPGRKFIGLHFDPTTRSLTRQWEHPLTGEVERGMDFDPVRGIGVVTSYNLVTRIIDLKTGNVLAEIDNSKNYRRSSGLIDPVLWHIFGGPCLFLIILAVMLALGVWLGRAMTAPVPLTGQKPTTTPGPPPNTP